MTQPSPSLSPVPPPPQAGIDIGGQIGACVNTFIDPPSVSKIIPTKLAWLVPFVIASILNIAMALIATPITANVFRNNPREGMTPEQAQQAAAMMEKFAMVGVITAPLTLLVITLIVAGLVMAVASVTGVLTRFGQIFSTMTYIGLIRALGVGAAAVVLKVKAPDIQTMQELAPRFGLDLVINEAPKVVMGVLRFFSIFTIWEMIVGVVIVAATFKISKGKAVALLAPAWLLGLVLTVVSTFFQK